jgi:hypothetical protein
MNKPGERRGPKNPRVLILGSTEHDLTVAPPFNHVPVEEAREADAVYLWMARPKVEAPVWEDFFKGTRVMFKLGQAQSLFKPVYIGSADAPLELDFQKDLRVIRRKQGIGPRNAYELLMADLDVTLPEEDEVLHDQRSSAIVRCSACVSLFNVGERVTQVRNVKGLFQYHTDCYFRMTDPEQVNAAIFHAGLVEALRKDNAKLEAELASYKEKNGAHRRMQDRGSRARKRSG